MTGVRLEAHELDPKRQRVYDELFALYKNLHDALEVSGVEKDLYSGMKRLLQIRDEL